MITKTKRPFDITYVLIYQYVRLQTCIGNLIGLMYYVGILSHFRQDNGHNPHSYLLNWIYKSRLYYSDKVHFSILFITIVCPYPDV